MAQGRAGNRKDQTMGKAARNRAKRREKEASEKQSQCLGYGLLRETPPDASEDISLLEMKVKIAYYKRIGYEVWSSMYQSETFGRVPLMVIIGHDAADARHFMRNHRYDVYECLEEALKAEHKSRVNSGNPDTQYRAVVYNYKQNDLSFFFPDRHDFLAIGEDIGVGEQTVIWDYLAFSDFAETVGVITHDYDDDYGEVA